jgi:hypothetical protein
MADPCRGLAMVMWRSGVLVQLQTYKKGENYTFTPFFTQQDCELMLDLLSLAAVTTAA